MIVPRRLHCLSARSMSSALRIACTTGLSYDGGRPPTTGAAMLCKCSCKHVRKPCNAPLDFCDSRSAVSPLNSESNMRVPFLEAKHALCVAHPVSAQSIVAGSRCRTILLDLITFAPRSDMCTLLDTRAFSRTVPIRQILKLSRNCSYNILPLVLSLTCKRIGKSWTSTCMLPS